LACVQDEEQLLLWYHGIRAAVMKLKSIVPPGSTVVAQMQAAARVTGAAQRWKAVRANTATPPRRCHAAACAPNR
jgi:hypothetical protein